MEVCWGTLTEDSLTSVFASVASLWALGADEEGGPSAGGRGLGALAWVCRHWRRVALGLPLWAALHWEHCRHTHPILPDLLRALSSRQDAGRAAERSYQRLAVSSRPGPLTLPGRPPPTASPRSDGFPTLTRLCWQS